MSASARKLTPAKLVAAFICAGALMVVAGVNTAHAQNDSVPAGSGCRHDCARASDAVERDGAARRNFAGTGAAHRTTLQRSLANCSRRCWLNGRGSPIALYGAALSAFNLGRPAEAEPLARAAAEIYLVAIGDDASAKSVSPEQRRRGADALVLLVVVLGARGAETEALKTVERAVVLAPEHFDAQFTLGRALYGVGDSPAAVKAFRAALRLKPDDARALFFLATALEGAGEVDAALSAYRELVRRQPQAAEGHLGLGVLLIKRGGGDAEKGIEELRTAVRIDPNQYEAQVTLGRALLLRKLPAESVEHLRRAAELAPANPEPHYQLALAYRRLGLHDKAVEETAIVKRIHATRRGEGAQTTNTARPNQ